MSGLYVLASGVLAGDPVARDGAKGRFSTATIRCGSGDDAVFVSVIAFGAEAERLLELAKGAAISAAGRATLKAWTSRDGGERHGISLVAAELAAPKPRQTPRQRSAYPSKPRRDIEAADPRPFNDELPSSWGEA
jgi:single-stranded DNA-binding protein